MSTNLMSEWGTLRDENAEALGGSQLFTALPLSFRYLCHSCHLTDSVLAQAFNMEGLIKKITTGPTPQLPSQYSEEWRELIKAMLSRDEEMRPSAGQILALPWLQVRSDSGQDMKRGQQCKCNRRVFFL